MVPRSFSSALVNTTLMISSKVTIFNQLPHVSLNQWTVETKLCHVYQQALCIRERIPSKDCVFMTEKIWDYKNLVYGSDLERVKEGFLEHVTRTKSLRKKYNWEEYTKKTIINFHICICDSFKKSTVQPKRYLFLCILFCYHTHNFLKSLDFWFIF